MEEGGTCRPREQDRPGSGIRLRLCSAPPLLFLERVVGGGPGKVIPICELCFPPL